MTPDSLSAVTLAISGAAYIVAALLFILSLAGLSMHEAARRAVEAAGTTRTDEPGSSASSRVVA